MKFDAIILAAGKGKRMKPFSDVISKPMLPLLNKPLVSLIAEQLLRIGAEKIVVTVSKSNEEEFKSYFQKQHYADKITYCLQDPPQGTADAIYKAGSMCSSKVIYSMAGDNLFSENFCKSMVEEFFKLQKNKTCIMALMEVTKEEITKLASVKMTETGLITSIVEKPKFEEVESTLASWSMYIFDKALLKYFGSVSLSGRGEYEAPDAFKAMMQHKETITLKGLINTDSYIHISNPFDLWKNNLALIRENENLIAKETKIGDNTVIKHSIIGENVFIGNNCIIEDSVILKNVLLPPNSNIQKSIIGKKESGYEQYIVTEKE